MQRKLDLRTGRPVWLSYRAPRVPVASLPGNIRTDVLVVGMGISGAMVAEALSADGHSVAMVDRRGPLCGSTAATTALVAWEIDQPLSKLVPRIGRKKAAAAWRRSCLAVAGLQARIDELSIHCNGIPRKSLFLAGDDLDGNDLGTEAEERRAVGLPAEYLQRPALIQCFGIDRDGAILSHGNLALDPRKLTAGLLLAAIDRGVRCYAPVEATKLTHGRHQVVVSTNSGNTITAAHVVLATGYELADLPRPARHKIISTWAIATRPQKRALWPEEAFIWESADPYLYIRTTSDGRVICGGEDEEFRDEAKRDSLIAEKSRRLCSKLAKLLPGIDPRPDFAWTGSFGTTTTGLPYIGKIPRRPRIHAVMGYGGNGITYAQIASEIIRTDLAGGEDIDAGLFAFEN
jgi:glycine/D-amino acid oxidase-like deaminating enzyme